MTFGKSVTRTLVAALVFTVGGVPEVLAQSTESQTTQPAAQNAPAQNDNLQNTNPNGSDPRFSGVRPDPSAGPQSPNLAPQAPESSAPQQPGLPSAPEPEQSTTGTPSATQSTTPHEAPSGTATAEKGTTRGGAASKPAGTAIAPAKQRQSRSLFIKLGVLAAAGIAVGTVAGLSRGTPSKPPGSSQTATGAR